MCLPVNNSFCGVLLVMGLFTVRAFVQLQSSSRSRSAWLISDSDFCLIVHLSGAVC